MKAFLEIEKHDINNNIIEFRRIISHSFLQAFPTLMARQWSVAVMAGTTRDGNPQISSSTHPCSLFLAGAPGGSLVVSRDASTTYSTYYDAEFVGIQVGSGTGAEATNNTSVGTRIAHGSGAGQLEYCGTRISNYQQNIAVDTDSFDIEAIFKNNSGGTVTVREVGIYCVGAVDAFVAYGNKTYCILRDLLASPYQVLLDGEYLKVKYIIQITT